MTQGTCALAVAVTLGDVHVRLYTALYVYKECVTGAAAAPPTES